MNKEEVKAEMSPLIDVLEKVRKAIDQIVQDADNGIRVIATLTVSSWTNAEDGIVCGLETGAMMSESESRKALLPFNPPEGWERKVSETADIHHRMLTSVESKVHAGAREVFIEEVENVNKSMRLIAPIKDVCKGSINIKEEE